MEMTFVGDLVMESGKTWKEENLEKTHNIPIGSLVEVKRSEYSDPCEGVRLHVITHGRDCDGTPLYWLGVAGEPHSNGGYSEDSLEVIAPPTDDILVEVEAGRKRQEEYTAMMFRHLLKERT
jgi:hypothetical protein